MVYFQQTPLIGSIFLGRGVDSPGIVETKCGSLKPCFHGSDAHENAKFLNQMNKDFAGSNQTLHLRV